MIYLSIGSNLNSKFGNRLDNITKAVSLLKDKTGWDSEMICYPCVVKTKEKYYMFYNGNSHGKTGFGYAELSL